MENLEKPYPYKENQRVFRVGFYNRDTGQFDWLHEIKTTVRYTQNDLEIDSIIEAIRQEKISVYFYCEMIEGIDNREYDHKYILDRLPRHSEGYARLKRLHSNFVEMT